MKFRAAKEIREVKGFEYQGSIHKGEICEVLMFDGFPAVCYKGKAICDIDSHMCKEYFEEVVE